MRKLLCLLFLSLSVNSNAQSECDCCNLYFLTDPLTWEEYFSPSDMRKNKHSQVSADYSYIDSNGVSQTEHLAVFKVNRKGYVQELKEFYNGIPNHKLKFDRKFKKRIKSSTFIYLNEEGEEMSDFGGMYTQYDYSKKTIKTRERAKNGEFKVDSIQSYKLVEFNSNGLVIASFMQFHFETGYDGAHHSEYKSEVVFGEGDTAIENSYLNDSLWIKKELVLTNFGRIKSEKMIYPINTGTVISQVEYEYNSDQQCIHQKSRTTEQGITECQDQGEFDHYFTYEEGLLRSILYTYGETELTITFSYQ